MNKKKISLFLLFAFGISWLSAAVLYFTGIDYNSITAKVGTVFLYMCAPAIAAIIVQKGFYKEPITALGLKMKETKWKQFLWIPVLYFLFCFLWIAVIAILGNGLHIAGFGSISFNDTVVLAKLNETLTSMGAKPLSTMPLPPAVLLITQLFSSLLIGGVVNTIFTLGEELGWRGFLYNETQKMGIWKSNVLIGTIWALWHAPIILQGHNYPEHPITGVFIMILFCVPLSFIMSYLRKRTNNVLAPALFHATINAIGGNLMLYTMNTTDVLGGIAGLSGGIACAILFLLIFMLDKKRSRRELEIGKTQ
jgi:uncharacterized protein